MKRRIGIFIVAAVVGVGLFACGGGDGKDGGGQHSDFLGSCNLVATEGACWEWAGPYLDAQTAGFEAGCEDEGGTWSEGSCPSEGRDGICSWNQASQGYPAGSWYRVHFYDLSTDDIPVMRDACTQGGATWST